MDICCERRTYSNISNTHHHNYAQLLLPLTGTLNIKTKINEIEIDDEHFFFLPSNLSHTFSSKNKNAFLVLDIPSPLLPSNKDVAIEMHQLLDERWKALRYLILNEINYKTCHSSYGLNNLISYVTHLLFEGANPVSIQYIHDHYNKKITIDQLASLENFNVSYYYEWFYKRAGLSPNSYIQKIRLNRAKSLLLDTNFSILEIAQLVGYDYQSSLTRVFKKYEGVTPKVFRERQG